VLRIEKQLSFPGDLASVAAAREQILQYVREYCWDEADEIDLQIALQEALANAALHGCGDDPNKTIYCTLEADPTNVSFVIRDPGPGFNYERIANPAHFESTTLEHGRGIALMRSLVDEVSFARGGSEVRLCKHLTC
jgi:serine/threonine-protein kinase RsbW